jgi:hypothetical protein
MDRDWREALVVGDVHSDPLNSEIAVLGEYEAFVLAAGVPPGDFQPHGHARSFGGRAVRHVIPRVTIACVVKNG